MTKAQGNFDRLLDELFSSKPFAPKKKVIRYSNGWVYEGEVCNGKRHGEGKLTFTNGNVYEGSFQNDLFSGIGTIYGPKGDIFRGRFRNGRREGKGYEYVVEGGRCTSYRCNYINGIREGKCTVMTCENFRFGKFNDWEGDRVEFYKRGELVETAGWEYSWLRDYRSYIVEREVYDNCGRDKYDAREWMEMITLDERYGKTPNAYTQDHGGLYGVLKNAFEEGLYYEIVDALVYGFSVTEHGEIPFSNWETRQEAIALYEALAKKGLLENKRNFPDFDDYMNYAMLCFYECIHDHPCDVFVDYYAAIPYVVADLYWNSEDWRYLRGVRRFYTRYVNGAVSYYIYLMDMLLLNGLEDGVWRAFEDAEMTYIFKMHPDTYSRAKAAWENCDYDNQGCWLTE